MRSAEGDKGKRHPNVSYQSHGAFTHFPLGFPCSKMDFGFLDPKTGQAQGSKVVGTGPVGEDEKADELFDVVATAGAPAVSTGLKDCLGRALEEHNIVAFTCGTGSQMRLAVGLLESFSSKTHASVIPLKKRAVDGAYITGGRTRRVLICRLAASGFTDAKVYV